MEVVQHRSLEKGNVRLQEWIHEELARGEALQRQYEALQERHARLDTLLQAKRLEAVEEKNRAQQNELEETQEALQKCWSWKSQCRLHVHKQERENRRMAESVAELGEEVFEQRRKEKSSKDLLREMKMDSGRLKRHLSAWDAECKAEDERIRERCQRLEKQRATLEELSLKSQELHRNKTPLEDRTIEAELEADLFQKKSFFGQARAQFLWNDRTPDRTKRFLWQNPEGIHSKKQLPSRCFLWPAALWTAWRLLWVPAKTLFLLLLLMVAALFLQGFFSGCPCCPRLSSTPLLYIQPEALLPPLYS